MILEEIASPAGLGGLKKEGRQAHERGGDKEWRIPERLSAIRQRKDRKIGPINNSSLKLNMA